MAKDRLTASLALDERVARVKGVSDARATVLSRLGISTVRDLLTHFPRRYIDMSTLASTVDAEIGQLCTVVGTVHRVESKRPKNIPLVELTLVDQKGTLMVTCFRQPWVASQFSQGDVVAVSGKVEFGYGFKRMTNPFIEAVDVQGTGEGRIIPIHPATEKISTAWMRRLVANALEECAGLEDPLPLPLRTRYRLYSRSAALRSIHFPHTMDEASQARRRLAFEELLLLELHLLRANVLAARRGGACAHVVDGPRVQALEAALPFALSDEQLQARSEIFDAMSKPSPANHMLLGDVGTGKTILAAFAIAAAADSGNQALMMGPTEVLVSQYGKALGPLLDAAGISWALLCGSSDSAAREDILRSLGQAKLDVLFGTHALLEKDVAPSSCSLVIIDEQQRFGAAQREDLVSKAQGGADVLSLTATPIPRSLALALYGNMTLSYIRKRPLNRAATRTQVFDYAHRGDAYEVVRTQLEAGHGAYVVCPLVGAKKNDEQDGEATFELSVEIEAEDVFEESDLRAVHKEAEILRKQVFPNFEVGVLHGRMKSEEKAEVMERFRAGEIQVLVATTVIEVGVDVPNATAMIVEDADRFGLAQLHQLRGRVGRGSDPGFVCLVSGTKSPDALERLSAMERTEDGFELAEYDLALRREGDILGNRQHGASALKLVNVMRDAAIIEEARCCAQRILDADPDLQEAEHEPLRAELARTFPPETSRRGS